MSHLITGLLSFALGVTVTLLVRKRSTKITNKSTADITKRITEVENEKVDNNISDIISNING